MPDRALRQYAATTRRSRLAAFAILEVQCRSQNVSPPSFLANVVLLLQGFAAVL